MTVDPRIAQADRCYDANDWGGALALYVGLVGVDPAAPLAAYHCCVELADAAVLARLAPPPAAPMSDRLDRVHGRTLSRALELCRSGDFARASALLRGTAPTEPSIELVYRADIDAPPAPAPASDGAPGFLAAGAATLDPAAARARFAGTKVLAVAVRLFTGESARRHEMIDNLMLSAARFGLDCREFNTYTFGRDMQALVDALAETLASWRPDLVLVENLATLDWAATPERAPPGGVVAAVRALLRDARARGTRVVASYPDIWYIDDALLHAGLGDSIDVIHHHHPTRIASAPAAARDRVFCFPYPYLHPPPTATPDSRTRYCFAGSVVAYNLPRLIWWAELGRDAAPIDFFETRHASALQRSDQAFVDLLASHRGAVNFTRRRNGIRILTGRAIETLLAGGLLIEEANADTAHFLERDTHYLAFDTRAELRAIFEALDRDPARRAAVRAAGHAWATRWFTGDAFWAGLLGKALG